MLLPATPEGKVQYHQQQPYSNPYDYTILLINPDSSRAQFRIYDFSENWAHLKRKVYQVQKPASPRSLPW